MISATREKASSDLSQRSVGSGSEALKDLISGLVPDERTGVVVPGGRPGPDGFFELFGRTVRPPAQPLVGELGEPQFHTRLSHEL